MSKQDAFDDNTAIASYPSLYVPPAAGPTPLVMALSNQSESACGKCSTPISSEPGLVTVLLSCRHLMHGTCFVRAVTEQRLEAQCNANFGGPRQCARCVAAIPSAHVSTSLNDRDDVLRYFRHNYVLKYRDVPYGTALLDAELSVREKQAILGITPGMFSLMDKTNYDHYSGTSSAALRGDEIVADLQRRGRTLTAIFATTAVNLNAQHLYRFGVRTLEQFKALGYTPSRFVGKEYRAKCPFWMMADLFGFDSADIFAELSADAVLASQLMPKELWLCGVTMSALVERGLTKQGFLAYKYPAHEVLQHLDVEHAHLIRLGVRRADLGESWNDALPANAQFAGFLRALK